MDNSKCLSWMVSKVSDPIGNYMTFSYQQYGGEIWIDRIDYTFLNDGTQAYASVQFAYDVLTNPNDMYIGGQKLHQSVRLRNISVKYQNSQVRRYYFDYNTSLQYERLSSVKLYNSSDELLSTTTVSWNTPSQTMVTDQSISIPREYHVVAGNFDGDRIYDVIAVNPTNFSVSIIKGSSNGPSDWVSTGYSLLPLLNPSPDDTEAMLNSLMAGDLDGDGIDELIYRGISVGINRRLICNSIVVNSP